MRFNGLFLLLAFVAFSNLQAKPERKDDPKPEAAFKPIEIKNELNIDDAKDEKLDKPAKKFTVKLYKDKTYVVDATTKDFDPYLRLLNKSGVQLAEDLDGGGDGQSKLVVGATETGDHQVVVTTFDGDVGKFELNVREVKLKGEAKPRELGKKPLTINDELEEKNKTDLGPCSKVFSVQLKAGKSYLIHGDSTDFAPQVFLFDAKDKLLGQDHSHVFHVAEADGEHRIAMLAFDGKEGKFELNIRELNIKGEAKPREVGKGGLKHNDELDEKNKTDLGDFSRVISVQLKAGKSYMFDAKSSDFDTQLYVFDSKNKLLAQDHAKVFQVTKDDGVYHLVVKAFDNKAGKFDVAVTEFSLKGEEKARDVGKNGLTVKDQIGNNDDTPVNKSGKVYSVNLKAGQTYTIDLVSQELDAYLYLFDSKNALLAQDDDSGGELNSRIIFRAERDGVYHIIATSLGGQDTGEFTLTVKKRE